MAGEIIKAEKVLKVGQRVEFFIDDNDERYTSRIEDIRGDQLIVALPVDSKHVPVIPAAGTKLYALAVGQQCRYRFFTEYKETGMYEGRIPVWYISYPSEVEKHQNREFVRVRVDLPLEVKLIEPDGTIKEPVTTRVVDLSGNGICFVMEHVVRVDSKVAISLSGITDIGSMEIMTQVARCTPVKRNDGKLIFHIGAAFQNLPRAVSNKIVRFIFEIQRVAIARGVSL